MVHLAMACLDICKSVVICLFAVSWTHFIYVHGNCYDANGNFYTWGDPCGQFMCHCLRRAEQCNTQTGACPSGCEFGWTGPGCQFRNSAFQEPVDTNFGLKVTKATDGYLTTCTEQTSDGVNPFIRVTLDDVIDVQDVIITFKNLTAVAGFSVYAGLSSVRDQTTLCYTDPGDRITDSQVGIVCTRRPSTKYITVQLEASGNKLEICEIELPNGRHLTYNKPSFGSSTESGEPKNANDGAVNKYFASNALTSPFWYVDLQNLYTINMIQIKNRGDGGISFIIGFQIHLSNTSDFSDAELVYTDFSSKTTAKIDIFIPVSYKVARYVQITVPGERRRLHMLEFWAFGGCIGHYCGMDCSKMCFCTDQVLSIANEIEGVCPGGCERNWRNIDGYCNSSICPESSFGHDCRYDCQCSDFCDPWSGHCMPELSSCYKHYHGDNCQAYNVIADSPSTLQGVGSSYSVAPATVDGLLDTCSPELSGHTSSWFVPFQTEIPVDQVLVYVNDSTTGWNGIEVTTEHGDVSVPCITVKLSSDGRYLARCGDAPSTHLRISTRSNMQICEVAVLECSDGNYGRLCEKTCLCANGSPCNKFNGSCPDGGCESGYGGGACDEECVAGTYGNNCTHQCGKCNNGTTCDIFTGECPTPCQAGWQGGRCDIECRNGTYGEDCLQQCGFCLHGTPCSKISGVCTDGCAAGYYTSNCTIECQLGLFGLTCSKTCGSCNNDDVCAPVDGACLSGCIVGKLPPTCLKDCPHGAYGQDCVRSCGKCRNNNTCNLVTGVCEDGCDTGVHVTQIQPMCKIECPNGLYGYNCSQKCIDDVCIGGNVCNKTSGACLSGCLKPGYQSPFCQSDCCHGTYGHECQAMCGMCKDRTHCNKSTGQCPDGCQPGYLGPNCLQNDPRLSAVSIVVLVLGCLLAVAGLVGIAIGYWIYKRGSLPWDRFKRRKRDKYSEKAPRNSVVSRVYENNIGLESDPTDVKNTNSNVSNYKLSEAKPRGTIALEEFWDFVQRKKSSRPEIIQQFKDLSVGLTHPCEAAKKAQNLRKNRYKEIFAYDHTRVKLDVLPGDIGNDYINACFINGYNRPHMYIATQGPTEEFVCDFWRMVWQKKCCKLVILTRLVEHNKVKCCQYWPDDGMKQYGNVKVEYRDSDTYADFTIRTFVLSVEGKDSREVQQFHYESWPDRHVPEYASSVVHFWNKVRTTDQKDNAPMIVHCSAGIGRTGAFISLDYLVDQANVENYVNVYQCVQNLRHQRVNMVQNQEQYLFLYEALVEALICPSCATPCDLFSTHYKNMLQVDKKTKKSKLELEFERLQCITKFQESMRPRFYDNSDYKAANNSANKEKNRVQHILPRDMHRPWLITRVYDRNDYINAVYLPSYREDKMFLQTQNPLPDTIVDFWRMVYENRVSTIVNLDRITNPSEIYWPKGDETLTFIPFTLHQVEETDHITYTEISLRLQNAEEPHEKAMIIKLFTCKFWMSEDRVPVGGESSFLTVYGQVQKWQQVNGHQPIVVHCLNGAAKSGLFCVVTSTLDRIRHEREVALQQTIKQMRIRRHQIVPSYEQYKFCHDILLEFLKDYETFSNFYI